MMRPIWKGGRLAWPPVIAVFYLAVAITIADYLWRVVVMPFEIFAILSLLILVVPGAIMALIGYRLARRPRGDGVEAVQG